MLGMFAAVEVYKEIKKPSDRSAYMQENKAKLNKLAPLKDYIMMKWTILRSAMIGTFVGILPGAAALSQAGSPTRRKRNSASIRN